MANVQPVLPARQDVSNDLHIVRSEQSQSITVMLGVAVLERIRCSEEELQYKMMIGRLVNAGWPLDNLRREFGHDPRTMKKWGAALLSEDPEFIVKAFSGRGASRKVSDPAAAFIRRRYRALRNFNNRYRQVIATEVAHDFGESVSREVLRLQFREADREDAAADTEHAQQESCGAGDMATDCPSEHDICAENDNRSPEPPEVEPLKLPAPRRPRGLHHAGMILFALLLDLFCRGRSGADGLQQQWISQVLQGAVNIEQSSTVSVNDLQYFTGEVTPAATSQGKALRQRADAEEVLDIYRANARLLNDGPGKGRVYYYDPHSKEYTGSHTMIKGWCGRRHGISKVMQMDMLHTRSGRPCFVQHYTPYYDMRERFFMTMVMFNRLFPEDQRRGRLFVIDRAIYGLEPFNRFKANGDDFLTWEKDYCGDGWEGRTADVVFSRYRSRNNDADLRRHTFECREEPWSRDPEIRRILVKATNPQNRTIEVSILCSDQQIDIREAVWLMFNRWLQENNFKYGDKHFGFNQITSYATYSIAEKKDEFTDQSVDSPEYRELKNSLQQNENALARELVNRDKAEEKLASVNTDIEQIQCEQREVRGQISKVLEQLRKTTDGTDSRLNARSDHLLDQTRQLRKRLRELERKKSQTENRLAHIQQRINDLKEKAAELNTAIEQTERKQSRIQLLIDRHYRMADTSCKAMFDALRISSFNMFANLVDIFRPIYNNYRNDHVMLRNLTRADGFIRRDEGTVYIDLWLRGRFQDRQLAPFRAFLKEITDRINTRLSAGSDRYEIRLLEAAPKL